MTNQSHCRKENEQQKNSDMVEIGLEISQQ